MDYILPYCELIARGEREGHARVTPDLWKMMRTHAYGKSPIVTVLSSSVHFRDFETELPGGRVEGLNYVLLSGKRGGGEKGGGGLIEKLQRYIRHSPSTAIIKSVVFLLQHTSRRATISRF